MACKNSERSSIEEVFSESVHIPLLHDTSKNEKRDSGSDCTTRPRNFTSPISSNEDLDFDRIFGGATSSPFAPVRGAFDESGTVIKPKSNYTKSNAEAGFDEHVLYDRDTERTKYEEAALYVQEGIDNEKFTSHPNGVFSKVAYKIVHNPFFYITEFIVCCLLMGLAIIEEPAWISIPAENKQLVIAVHSSLELLFLSILTMNILLGFIWMKPRTFLRQRKALTIVIMAFLFIEALVVLVRRENHVRVTRCLRPVFFLDSYIMAGVRRVLRQIFQCLKPILDVMLLLFFMVAIFALAGYYLFAETDPTFFDSYLKSFVSLFITLTTANHPDVFMEAYVKNRASPLFFILYLFVTLYFFSNVLLAVVYAHFSDVDKKKFRKLFLHKREALRLAYFHLAKERKGINFHDFMLFMLEYKPRIAEHHVMCIFKALQNNPNPQEFICLEEFLNFYDVQNLRWKEVKKDGRNIAWYESFTPRVKKFFLFLHKVVKFKYFNSIIGFIVILNALFLILYSLITSFNCASDGTNMVTSKMGYCGEKRFMASRNAIVVSFFFTTIYILEIMARLLALGPKEYFRKWWNRFDFMVIFLSFLLLCIEASSTGDSLDPKSFLIVVRPIKLLRLLRLKKRYYEIMNTVFFLGHRLLSVLLLLVVVFYIYAIIGMEAFAGAVYVGCCEKALFGVSSYYQANASVNVHEATVYWLNNFDNIYQSYVILYEEMIVNNWFVQMEGFVSETNIASRLFFFAFWITTTICLSVAIAYIVDAFVFRVQAMQQLSSTTDPEHHYNNQNRKKTVKIYLVVEEIDILRYEITRLEQVQKTRAAFSISVNSLIRSIKRKKFNTNGEVELVFVGKRLRTREDISHEMYKDELEVWIQEREDQINGLQDDLPREKSLKDMIWKRAGELVSFLLE